jgi:hypothetical protein
MMCTVHTLNAGPSTRLVSIETLKGRAQLFVYHEGTLYRSHRGFDAPGKALSAYWRLKRGFALQVHVVEEFWPYPFESALK